MGHPETELAQGTEQGELPPMHVGSILQSSDTGSCHHSDRWCFSSTAAHRKDLPFCVRQNQRLGNEEAAWKTCSRVEALRFLIKQLDGSINSFISLPLK